MGAVPEGAGAGNRRGRFRQENRDRPRGCGERDAAVRTAVTDCHDRRRHRPKPPSERRARLRELRTWDHWLCHTAGLHDDPAPCRCWHRWTRERPTALYLGPAAHLREPEDAGTRARRGRVDQRAARLQTAREGPRLRRRPPGAAPAPAAAPGSRGGAEAVLCHLRRRHRPGDAPGRGGGTAMTAESDPLAPAAVAGTGALGRLGTVWPVRARAVTGYGLLSSVTAAGRGEAPPCGVQTSLPPSLRTTQARAAAG